MDKLILSAGTVLPVSSPPLRNASVLVIDGKIRDVGKTALFRKKYGGVTEKKLGGGILLPGFVNAHVHLELGWTQARIGRFKGFTGWLEQLVKAKKEKIGAETLEASVAKGIDSLIQSGVTTVGEISSYGGIDKPLLKKSGLRVVLFKEILDSNAHKTDFSSLERDVLYEERLFPHAPYSCEPGLLKKVLRSHGRNGVPFGIHLAESPDEVEFTRGTANRIESRIYPLIGKLPFKRPVAPSPFSYLVKTALEGGARATLIHMVQAGSGDAAEASRLGLGVVLCPRSNLFLQVGPPPVVFYSGLDRLGLGTDGLSSNYNLDFFEELRAFHLLVSQSAGNGASYRSVYAATLGGARALYIEDRTGSIGAGKEADLIYLDARGGKDPYLSVIASSPGDLGLLMVRGKILHARPA